MATKSRKTFNSPGWVLFGLFFIFGGLFMMFVDNPDPKPSISRDNFAETAMQAINDTYEASPEEQNNWLVGGFCIIFGLFTVLVGAVEGGGPISNWQDEDE